MTALRLLIAVTGVSVAVALVMVWVYARLTRRKG